MGGYKGKGGYHNIGRYAGKGGIITSGDKRVREVSQHRGIRG